MNAEQRWSAGTEIYWERGLSGGKMCIQFLDRTDHGGYLRALVWVHSKRDFEVILFQGKGRKDTKTHWPRWQNVESIVLRHLTDIDRDLGRPFNRFKFPTLRDATAPKRGDVVVFKTNGRNDLYYQEGGMGLVLDTKDPSQPERCQVQIEEGDNSWVVPKHDEVEVIDHDPDLLEKDDDVNESKSQVFEEDGWEYWLEMSTDNGLYLWKKCKTCKSLHPRIVRQIA